MKKILGLISACLLLNATSLLAAGTVQFISPEELKENLNGENISILDARSERGWSNSDVKIPGAIRATWDNFDEWSTSLPKDNKLVLYCS
ncbi:Rhodanese-like domain-containing protein [Candidatus Electrothrix laxa]